MRCPTWTRRGVTPAALALALLAICGCSQPTSGPVVPADAEVATAEQIAGGVIRGAVRSDGWVFAQWVLARLQKDCAAITPEMAIWSTRARYRHHYTVDLVLLGELPDCAPSDSGRSFAEIWTTTDGVSLRHPPSEVIAFRTPSDWYGDFIAGDPP